MNIERINYLGSAKDRYQEKDFLPSGVIAFYTEIFEYQKEILVKTESSLPAVELYAPEEGKSLFKPDNLIEGTSLDAMLKESVSGLIPVITKHHPEMDFSETAPILTGSGSPLSPSYKNLLAHDFESLQKTSENLKILTEGYLFLIINGAKPVMNAIREANSPEPHDTEWLQSACPFCGYLAEFASINEAEDNRLLLHCGLCEMKWRFTRLTCVNCGNDDREKLKSYESEIDPIHSIYCCEECRAYIKIFRIPKSRDITSIDLYAENIISNYLDATAIDMGYSRP